MIPFIPWKKNKSTLSFSQIRASRLGKAKQKLLLLREFFLFLLFYFYLKFTKLGRHLIFVGKNAPAGFSLLKFTLTRKLIWGRGRLIRPFVSFSVSLATLAVFFTGGLFQYKFVEAEFGGQKFVSSEGYIIPQRITATTEFPLGRVRDTEIEYEIKSGDTLSSIGREFGVTVETIRFANNITDPNSLRVGQKLSVPPVSGVIHTVKSGDTLDSLAKKYAVATQAIADFNYLNEPFLLDTGQKIIIPDARIPSQTAVSPKPGVYYDSSAYGSIPYAGSGKEGEGNFIWPTRYHVITQYFSWYHPGLDIGIPSPLYASDSGTVVRSGWWANGYGFAVQIDHGNGFVTTYAHMSKIDVSVGDEVGQGQELGMMGSTGRSTGPHVHFTIQYYGKFKNPLDYL
jgi:murein DD-endopeptidase MepM/ murein hydrolase activator NlpD